jgi:hypothetical protein
MSALAGLLATALVASDGIKPAQEGVFDYSAPEMALFALGILATIAALAVGVWLFLHASREERARAQRDAAREPRTDSNAEDKLKSTGGDPRP